MTEIPKQTSLPTSKSALQQIRDLAKKLTPAERRELLDAGAYIPPSTEGVLSGIRKFGFLCRQCGEVGLEVVGESFEISLADGTTKTVTPNHPREFPQLPWLELHLALPQNPDKPVPKGPDGNPAHPIRKRSNPRCAHCGQQMRKNQTQDGPHPDIIVSIEFHRKAGQMDRATTRERYNEFLMQYPDEAAKAGAR